MTTMTHTYSDRCLRSILRRGWPLPVLFFFGILIGCGPAVPVSSCVPATGIVLVDNEPAEGVMISLHSAAGGDSISHGVSGKDGKFSVSTYTQGDGAEPGDYTVTCQWSTYNALKATYTDDRLKGKYSNPKKSDIMWTLSPDTPATAKRIELVIGKSGSKKNR